MAPERYVAPVRQRTGAPSGRVFAPRSQTERVTTTTALPLIQPLVHEGPKPLATPCYTRHDASSRP